MVALSKLLDNANLDKRAHNVYHYQIGERQGHRLLILTKPNNA